MADELAASDLWDEVEAYQREDLREEVEELIRNAYREGWKESKRWPNHPKPPHIEVLWGIPGGIRIQEDHTQRMED